MSLIVRSDMAEGRRIDHLDGLRAIAIGAVISVHWLSWYTPFLHGGSVGVDVFFVLSGYIITTLLWRRPATGPMTRRWWSFVKRRTARLYPALLGLVAGAIALYALVPVAPLAPGTVAHRGILALTQSTSFWAASQHGSFTLPSLAPFPHTWSLAVEWYFYLLWPLAVFTAQARGVRASSLAVGSGVVALVLYLGSLPLSDYWFYFGPSARAGELLAGGTLALWSQGRPAPPVLSRGTARVATVAIVAILAVVVFGPRAHGPYFRYVDVPVTVAATAALIRYGYADHPGFARRVLTHRCMTGLGRVSYSLYLWHVVPILVLENGWIGVPKGALGALVVVSTVALTTLSYRFLERPFLQPRRTARTHVPALVARDAGAAHGP